MVVSLAGCWQDALLGAPSPRDGEEMATKTFPARILVVDDENGPRQALRILLNEYYEVKTASSVADALVELERTPIDVIVTDIRMPHATGLDLLREARLRQPDVQVILLTGYGQLSTAMEAIEHGAFAYLEKPFDHQVMLDKIRASLERQKMEKERRSLERIALEANQFETLGHIVSGTLHDLGTPLSVIGSHLDLLLVRPTEEEVMRRVSTMRGQVEHCNDLVRNTMGMLRHRPGHREAVALSATIEMCCAVARPLLNSSSVRLETRLNPNLRLRSAELVQVRQAVLNLIYNAIQAMEEREDKWLLVETYEESQMACVAVEDNGPGVPVAQAEQIFEALYSTKGEKGTGLGLAVVRNVMMRHGGTVHLEQHENRGARFVLKFPVGS
ncbi:MAG: response regulator [Candidatus Hydrogenedens sp.]|nr:response regulator [Candidatus Hydrogenedens sp.]